MWPRSSKPKAVARNDGMDCGRRSTPYGKKSPTRPASKRSDTGTTTKDRTDEDLHPDRRREAGRQQIPRRARRGEVCTAHQRSPEGAADGEEHQADPPAPRGARGGKAGVKDSPPAALRGVACGPAATSSLACRVASPATRAARWSA